VLSDCSLACIFYRSLQRPQRLKGGILTEENEGNEEEIGRSPSSLSSVSSVIFCKKDWVPGCGLPLCFLRVLL